MQKANATIVVLGAGGTIAGTADDSSDNLGYRAAQLGVAHLVHHIPALAQVPLECEQVAQIDSKDMGVAVWRQLVQRVAHHLARPDVAGIVVTHGTDTLEETAYLLQRVLAPSKPVVLTAAMRPSTSLQADGPQNLLDAVRMASHAGAQGVLAVLASAVHGPLDVRKARTYRIDAFDSGDAGPLAWIVEGQVRRLREWPAGRALGLDSIAAADWPRVEIVTSHAGADGGIVDALMAAGVRGIVAAGTGHGTLHRALEAALLRARATGVRVLRCSRVGSGPVMARPDDLLPAGGDLSPVKARIELMLELLVADRAASAATAPQGR